jgi:hypothetical protein
MMPLFFQANIKASVDDLLRLLVVRQQELQAQREEIQRTNKEKVC